jgi:FkbM family methyltransferase
LKALVLRSLRRFGLDVRLARKNPNLGEFLIDRRIDLVFDIGANAGQFGARLRDQGYRGKIISFEPVASVFQRLSARAKEDGAWEAHDCALGAAPGGETINVSKDSLFSSMLGLSDAARVLDEHSAVDRTEKVQVRMLDEVTGPMSGEILIKIDTQGYERQVLEGGKRTLLRAKGVLMELPIIQIYRDTWRLHEALEYMDALDFVPTQIRPVNHHAKDRMALVEVDCLFRPRDPRLD